MKPVWAHEGVEHSEAALGRDLEHRAPEGIYTWCRAIKVAVGPKCHGDGRGIAIVESVEDRQRTRRGYLVRPAIEVGNPTVTGHTVEVPVFALDRGRHSAAAFIRREVVQHRESAVGGDLEYDALDRLTTCESGPVEAPIGTQR